MRGGGLGLPARTQHKDFGAVAAAWGDAGGPRRGRRSSIEVAGPRRSDGRVPPGTYLALAALNRLVAPCSKLAFADWWAQHGGAAGSPRSGAPALDHRRFWDAMDAVDAGGAGARSASRIALAHRRRVRRWTAPRWRWT